jgi:hypothetical protein
MSRAEKGDFLDRITSPESFEWFVGATRRRRNTPPAQVTRREPARPLLALFLRS